MREDAAAEVLAKRAPDAEGDVGGEIVVMVDGGEVGLQVLADRAVQEGGCRSASAVGDHSLGEAHLVCGAQIPGPSSCQAPHR